MSENTTHDKTSTTSTRPRQTPQRQIRIPDELYYPAVAKAKSEGSTLASVIAGALAAYLAEDA